MDKNFIFKSLKGVYVCILENQSKNIALPDTRVVFYYFQTQKYLKKINSLK